MRKPVLFLLALAIATALFWLRRPAPAPQKPVRETQPAPQLPQPRKELYTAPRTPIAPPRAMGISTACAQFWDGLRGLDLSQKDTHFPSAAGCELMQPTLQKWHKLYLEACKVGRTDACDEALYGYRAAVTDSLTEQVPLAEISDPRVLTDKMVARLLRENGSPADVADVAERLLQLDPDMPQAARAAAVSRLSAAQSAAGKPDDPLWKKVDEALEQEGRSIEADPRSYYETRLYAENLRYSDPERLRERAEEISKQRPELGVGPYHEAWAEFDSGHKQRAIEMLQEAIRREPGDARFRATLENLQRGDTQPFQVNLGFNITPR
jgi:tetratricopeptide (TPR) repeat protein